MRAGTFIAVREMRLPAVALLAMAGAAMGHAATFVGDFDGIYTASYNPGGSLDARADG